MTTSDSSEHSDAESKHLAVYDVILMVSQAHHSNCDYTEEQTRGLIRRPIASPVSKIQYFFHKWSKILYSFCVFEFFQPPTVCSSPEVASSTVENEEMRRIWLWQQFTAHVTPTVQRVVEFAKRVPGKRSSDRASSFCNLCEIAFVNFFGSIIADREGRTEETTCDF